MEESVKCSKCGTEVFLENSWANECNKCGTEYNGSGQRLADRSQWGDESYCGDRMEPEE